MRTSLLAVAALAIAVLPAAGALADAGEATPGETTETFEFSHWAVFGYADTAGSARQMKGGDEESTLRQPIKIDYRGSSAMTLTPEHRAFGTN